MKKSILWLMATGIWMVACNMENAGQETEKIETDMEQPEMDHGSMGHGDANAEVNEEYLWVPEDARVFFKNLKDGDEVRSPVKVEMGVEGMEVRPAGEPVKGTGHHHILINSTGTSKGDVIPFDEVNIHYGQGQTETELELEPGEYTLTLQFANGMHQSYGGQMAASVTILVR